MRMNLPRTPSHKPDLDSPPHQVWVGPGSLPWPQASEVVPSPGLRVGPPHPGHIICIQQRK